LLVDRDGWLLTVVLRFPQEDGKGKKTVYCKTWQYRISLD
jgi:hypothetical protein